MALRKPAILRSVRGGDGDASRSTPNVRSRELAGRRGFVTGLLGLPLALAGCAWTPLYAEVETAPGDIALAEIQVEPIPERIGQRLALALRRSFNPDGAPVRKRYVMRTTLQVLRQDLGVQSTGLGSRGKLDATVSFWLRDIKTGTALLANSVHTSESFDILANNYASVVAEEDARIRAVEELRRDIVTRLTLFLQRRAAEGGPKLGTP